ncbi:MAG: CBS domain-containing protein [Myxococcales bacterium]|nr:CBS domain-containing protein [Myxococcales bacterium]MDP3502397.1 CBS domain-containing protein [Myxococcales bacterium]
MAELETTQRHKEVDGELNGESRREYMQMLLSELRALERMVKGGAFERGVSRIGAEQELFLVDSALQPTGAAMPLLEKLKDPTRYTTELGAFNLEMNASSQPFEGDGLAKLEAELHLLYGRVREQGATMGVTPVLAGILPTIQKTDLGLENMVPKPRYQALNRAMQRARGEHFDFSIRGIDELVVKHDSVMVEATCASFQVHLQLTEPERFAQMYNLAQLLTAPVLAVGTNSPLLFGRRLWSETRIAVFEQSCDIRTPGLHLRDSIGRVSFGRNWLQGSVVDLFKENVSRFRPLVGTPREDADGLEALEKGLVPSMKALRLHSGTVYRWNRPCYGISDNGKPHLRIELRCLPSGPTIADEMANGAFWLGLMNELGATIDDVSERLEFDHARSNLYAAARDGLRARFTWLDGEEVLAQPFILERLLPLAKAGLERAKVNAPDIARYLSIIEKRTRSLHTGSSWQINSLVGMKGRGTPGARATALVAGMVARQKSDSVVADWELATLNEKDAASTDFQKVSQLMVSDIYSVSPDDPVELVSELMAWERVRYVPVEDEKGRLIGLVSTRGVMRHLTDVARGASERGGSVSSIMKTDLITVTPDTATTAAVALMKRHKVGALPVVVEGHLVAMLTENEFVDAATRVLGAQAPAQAKAEDVVP